MMNYKNFKDAVVQNFLNYMPEQYKHMKVMSRPINKVNVIKDGLTVIEEGSTKIAPTIYIDDIFEYYQEVGDFDVAMHVAATNLVNAMENIKDNTPVIDFETAKDNIVFQLVNTEQNKEFLQEAPNRPFLDLSIIYRWILRTDNDGSSSIIIKNDLAEKLGLSEEQLYELASENTNRIFPYKVASMNEVLRTMLNDSGMSYELINQMIEDVPDQQMMWIISNKAGINGAASMLYKDKLYELAEKIGTNLYILPSSVHEVIAISTHAGYPETFARMVTEVNMNEVAENEKLSDNVYHYDRFERKLSIANNH